MDHGENICPSRKQARYAPRAAKNKRGEWVFIVNSIQTEDDLEIFQVIDWEICQVGEAQECRVDGFSIKKTCQ